MTDSPRPRDTPADLPGPPDLPELTGLPDLAGLSDRWRETLLAARAGASGPDPLPYAENLLARWAEPQRRYHTTAHLTAVLDRIDTLAPYADDVHAVRLAAWFHDAVYRPDRTENEER
ncbi:hypothetical protein ABZ943_38810, partial [Streptomyces rubiginosohelvolus]